MTLPFQPDYFDDPEFDEPSPRKRTRRGKILDRMPDQKKLRNTHSKIRQSIHESKPKGFKHRGN